MEGVTIKAKAKVTLTKLDNAGNILEISEQEVELTRKEVEEICRLQQPEQAF